MIIAQQEREETTTSCTEKSRTVSKKRELLKKTPHVFVKSSRLFINRFSPFTVSADRRQKNRLFRNTTVLLTPNKLTSNNYATIRLRHQSLALILNHLRIAIKRPTNKEKIVIKPHPTSP